MQLNLTKEPHKKTIPYKRVLRKRSIEIFGTKNYTNNVCYETAYKIKLPTLEWQYQFSKFYNVWGTRRLCRTQLHFQMKYNVKQTKLCVVKSVQKLHQAVL